MELSETEREELMACKFVVIRGKDDEVPAKLIDIDYDIGATIINRDDVDHYLYCLIGKPAMTKKQYGEYYTYWEDHPGLYDEMFECVVKGIRSGKMKFASLNQITDKHSTHSAGEASSKVCAFNQ